MTDRYDCIILGSGLFGAATALVLSRCGLRTLVVEAKSHPRFAIGESMVPTTTRGLDYLARTYGVPELREISHYLGLRRIGCAGWPKQAFWFGYSRPGEPMSWSDQLQYISPGLPDGPDVHVLRADTDAYLVSRFADYGVAYRDRTSVGDVRVDGEEVVVPLAGDAGAETVTARYLVDCTGYVSPIGRRFALRDPEPTCRTNSRTIFSHFRDVPFLEDVLGRTEPIMVNSRDVTTIHHCFDSGWFWVIRFDNDVVSVGVTLDRDRHPDSDLPAEQEFWDVVDRFPTIRAHLRPATPIRPFVKTGRLQYTSSSYFRDRVAVAPHAAGFLDALFSTGMNLSQAFLSRFVPRLLEALEAKDLSPTRFAEVDQASKVELDTADLIVHGMFKSFRHVDLFKQYWRTWVFASIAQYLTQASVDPTGPPLALYGGSLSGWRAHLETMYRTVSGAEDPIEGARRLQRLMDSVDEPFAMEWAIGGDEPAVTPTSPRPGWFERLVQREPALRTWRPRGADSGAPGEYVLDGLERYAQHVAAAGRELHQQYRESKRLGTSFHKDVAFIRSNQFFATRPQGAAAEPAVAQDGRAGADRALSARPESRS